MEIVGVPATLCLDPDWDTAVTVLVAVVWDGTGVGALAYPVWVTAKS